MTNLITIIKICAILTASAMIGNWFLTEVRTRKRNGEPWYSPYFTIPGILVVCIVILLPIIAWVLSLK